jgi:Flp pilus assembly protein CpaB
MASVSTPKIGEGAVTSARDVATPSGGGYSGRSDSSGRRARRPGRALIGILLVVLSTLAGAVAFQRADRRVPVVVVARPVAAGQPISASDLRIVAAGANGPQLMPARLVSAVSGRVAAVALRPGTPLLDSELRQRSPNPPGTVAVPLSLKDGDFPPGLTVGARVLVVALVPSEGSGQPASTRTVSGLVDDLQAEKAFGAVTATTVTVQLPEDQAPALVAGALAGDVVLAGFGR